MVVCDERVEDPIGKSAGTERREMWCVPPLERWLHTLATLLILCVGVDNGRSDSLSLSSAPASPASPACLSGGRRMLR